MDSLATLNLQFSRVERRGVHVLVTLSRPERKNALHPAAHDELERVFDVLTHDGARCIILTGDGDDFCAGYDLRDNLETGVMRVAAKGFGGLTSRVDYPVPIVAAIQGAAMGGGFELALACDIIIAADTAKFALPEAKVGWSPLAGGLQRLPRIIGEKHALGMVLTGRVVSAQEGCALGFVNEVTTPDKLMSSALAWADAIAACAPLAIACNRHVMKLSQDMDLAAALDVSHFPAVDRMLGSEDAIEGKRAFVERRAPVWRGK